MGSGGGGDHGHGGHGHSGHGHGHSYHGGGGASSGASNSGVRGGGHGHSGHGSRSSTYMTAERASAIQSHADRSGRNEDFKERAMSAADHHENNGDLDEVDDD